MGQLGLAEIIVIGALILLFFGTKKLPALGQSLGKTIRGFKDSMMEVETEAKAVKDEANVTTQLPQGRNTDLKSSQNENSKKS